MDPSAVVRQLTADAAEFIVTKLQHAGDAAHVAEVHLGNLHAGFVTGVMVHVGPGVLQEGAHLDLEPDLIQFRMLRVKV